MIKKLFILESIFFCVVVSSQVLTYVGNSALVTVQSQTLFYNGGGLQTSGNAVVNNSGNVMINGSSSDLLSIASTSNFNIRLASITDYGQLYVSGITQSNITGKVNKEYTADYDNGITGRQQTGLPFYNFTYADLKAAFGNGNLNLTDGSNTTSGRFNPSSIFKWNNAKARFDQIVGGLDTDVIGTPLTYYIIPRRRADNTYFWSPSTEKKTFTGIPVSDATTSNVVFSLSGAYAGSFGTNGNASNYFGEKYYSYLDDPFRSKSPNWASDYALNLYQLANPFLTNIDLKFIATNETGNMSDGNLISNLVGIAYYGSNQIANTFSGTTYGSAIIATVLGGAFQGGDISANKLVIKPMGEFMVKLSDNTAQTLDLSKTRRFKGNSRADGVDYSVTAAKGTTDDSGIPADKIVKQVAVVMYDLEGNEIDRTYYAVSPSATTVYNPSTTNLQAYAPDDKKIYTKEEKQEGGEDANYSDKLYINEANEISFKSKLIPLTINYTEQPYQLKFEVYEKGERMPDGLSNGNSFYLENQEGQYIKIADGDAISMNGSQNLGLYYEMPEGGTLGTGNANISQTIIAKKNNNWVVRFAPDWKQASVEVYSVAGQLLNSISRIPTTSDFTIPLNYQSKNVFVVKAVSEKGEVVIKKIVN